MTSTPSHRLVRFRPHDTLDRVFAVTVAIKGLDGLLELIGGLALLLVTPEQVERLASAFTGGVLGAALPDTVAVWAVSGAERLTAGGLAFGAAYLLLHGLVKVILVVALLRDKLWAYPLMIVALLGFIAFQGYELAIAPSWALAGLTGFDIVMVALTWREYRRHRQQPRPPAASSEAESAQLGLKVGAPS